MDDSAADKAPTMNKPGRPGMLRAMSITKYGKIWSYLPTTPLNTGSHFSVEYFANINRPLYTANSLIRMCPTPKIQQAFCAFSSLGIATNLCTHSGVMPTFDIHIVVRPTETIQKVLLTKGDGSKLLESGGKFNKSFEDFFQGLSLSIFLQKQPCFEMYEKSVKN